MTKCSNITTTSINLRSSYNTNDAYKTYFNWVWFLFGCYIILAIITAVYAGITGDKSGDSSTLTYFSALLSPLMFFALFCWQNRGRKYDVKKCIGLDKKVSICNIIISIVIAIVSIICFAQITTIFDTSLQFIGYHPQDGIGLLYNNFGYLLLNLLLLAVLPAICEELIFRGIILNGLKKEHSPAAAILISAALFTLMHGSLQQTLYQFILGTILATLMYYTSNVIYPIITHFLSNAIVIVSNYISIHSGGESEVAATITTSQLIIGFVLALVGLTIMYLIIRFYLKPKSSNDYCRPEKYKNIMTYTSDERRYTVLSISIAIILWLINTIYQFTI